jgi:2-C-methyl-D-erythritol 4-phosphate cytidylyltransferase
MPNRTTYAIIPAGGIGKRMQSQNPKQFLTIFDEPILLHTVKALAKTGLIQKFIIPSVDIVYTKKILNHIEDVEFLICKSGKTRQESIKNALDELKRLNEESDFILIHDAVRVLVQEQTVINVINKAKEKGAAVAARPVSDTLKLSHLDENGDVLIKKNVSRDLLWQTQTPQVFAAKILYEAYEQAKDDHFLGTDSAGLVERINKDVYLVESPQSNIKITDPEDIELVKLYMSLKK